MFDKKSNLSFEWRIVVCNMIESNWIKYRKRQLCIILKILSQMPVQTCEKCRRHSFASHIIMSSTLTVHNARFALSIVGISRNTCLIMLIYTRGYTYTWKSDCSHSTHFDVRFSSRHESVCKWARKANSSLVILYPHSPCLDLNCTLIGHMV